MYDSAVNTTQVIQAILAPAVMISFNGLFFLGLNARQTSVFSRIRSLNDEKRKILREINNKQISAPCDALRCLNIETQLSSLLQRGWYIRNCIICCSLSVGVFVLTSLAIGMLFYLEIKASKLPLYLFIIGMLLVLCEVIFLCLDELISYSVILLEAKEKIN
ncbi:MAG: DUF2721 domain-containing protein [Oscillatoriaceae bacterium SKW80]|nr:DUF2721 domain-containing protein [Oscillatoriaceae bacterium SKYG93]MCX8121868.1 DUF2721 domain-containing protein [Oscillatoriaceae bacterium SKW80]MDW8454629.1 DUF2721 domain-containing protein [Oscillatoriaceae cyanobacterium SKYGB_i_bin93]HIK27439.1 DUF2721 domain-containing protein [Oscillatoriaceae cyanobacterium M7585_C2015_266]